MSALAAGAALAMGPENFWGNGVGLFQLVRGLVQLATAIVFFIWLYRANANVRALGADDMMGSPGLGVGWFFIPLANLFMPYMTVRDIWRASAQAEGLAGRARADCDPALVDLLARRRDHRRDRLPDRDRITDSRWRRKRCG